MSLSKSFIFSVECNKPEMICAKNFPTSSYEIKQLSDIDDQEGLRFIVPLIFFYAPLIEEQRLDPTKAIRDGLIKALQSYYPLAGRVFEGANKKLMVNCNNEGILFVEAEANVKLEQLGDAIFPPCVYADKLLCDVSQFGITNSPIFFFQVTRFICGGFSLGIQVNHTLVDGYGLSLFLNAIGELLKGAHEPSISPVWQRELLNARSPPVITCIHNEFEDAFSNNVPLVYPVDTFVQMSVFFGPREIQGLHAQLPPSQAASYSVFDLITACLWKCRTIALKANVDDIVRVSILLNARFRKGIELPKGYYGNAFVYPAAISKAGLLCASPLTYALHLIRCAKDQMSKEYVKSVADLMVIKDRPRYIDKWNFIVSDLTKTEFSKLDFGWGEPLFGGVPLATPVISFYNKINMQNEGGTGVVVPICLPSLAREKFQHELKNMTRAPTSKI